MIDAVVGFVALLRRHGLDIGTDRTLTAARSLRHVDLADRLATRRALRLTLVANRHDEIVFDEVFERWFDGSPGVVGRTATSDDADPRHRPLPVADAELTLDTERRLHDAVYVDDPSERIGVTTDRSGDTTTGAASAVVDPRGEPIRAAVGADTSVGGHLPGTDDGPTERGTTLDDAATPLHLPDDHDPSGAEISGVEISSDDLDRLLARLTAERRHRLDALDPQHHGPLPTTLTARPVLANPFDAEEQRKLERVVGLVRPQLEGSTGWRRRPDGDGEIDLRRTLRQAATTAGVPMRFRRRSTPPTRARVVVLLDTSLSVRPSARLMLHLAHRLRSRVGRVRVLAFIDRCVDVTDVILHADLATALGRLLDDAPGGPLDPARSSDYGTALRSMWNRHADLLGPRTTVFVLGDGRSNGRDPAVERVHELTERCRRTIWLTPEPRGAWGFGFGEMAAYADAVDVAWTVRSLDDLLALAGSGLIRPPDRGARRTPAPLP